MPCIINLESGSGRYINECLLVLDYLIEFVDVGDVLLDEIVIALRIGLGHEYLLVARVLS